MKMSAKDSMNEGEIAARGEREGTEAVPLELCIDSRCERPP